MCNANRTYFGRFEDGILESPFSGNLSDICPTGVYTDKPSRYFGRRWDYQREPSLCINCSLGCHTVASIKYREVKRQEARLSKEVNGYFICDRGRYGFFYTSLDSRPRQASIDGENTTYDGALRAAIDKLGKIISDSGTAAIAAVGSDRSSLETQAMLTYLCQLMDWRTPAFFMDPVVTSKVKASINRLEPDLAVSMREVEKADFVLCIGADPINEAPMLALAMRQAQRNGAKIVVVDPRPVPLPMDFDHLVAAVDDISALVGLLIKAAVDRETAASCGQNAAKFFDTLSNRNLIAGYQADLFKAATDDLKKSQRPVIVCGTDVVPGQVPGMAADFALLLRTADKKAGLFYLLPGANAFGAGLLSGDEASLLNIVEAIENGDVKSLILVESDPFLDFSDRSRLERALDTLDLLIVLDYLNSDSAQKAHIFMPSTTLYEADGIFVNQEGRAQMVRQSYSGGVPIVQSGRGSHPPRVYGSRIPGADAKPAWQTLAELADEKLKPEEKRRPTGIYKYLAGIVPELAVADFSAAFPDNGVRVHSGAKTDLRFTSDTGRQTEAQPGNSEKLSIVMTDLTFGTEVLSAHSECLRELEPEPAVFLHTSEARNLDLADGSRVSIQTESGSLEAKLKVVENMAPGVLIVPRHRNLSWQIFAAGMSSISRDQIKKAAALS
jgi:NADH-quinone oxidoreductase subunit G